MLIAFLWATSGNKMCANSVQAWGLVQNVCKLKLWPEFVQKLCKLWRRSRVIVARPAGAKSVQGVSFGSDGKQGKVTLRSAWVRQFFNKKRI